MGEDWVKLLDSSDRFQVEVILQMLKSHDLRAVKLDKQDSAYLSIGSIEIYVHRDDIIKAKFLIDNPDT